MAEEPNYGAQAGPRALRRLLDAVLVIGSQLDLETVLQRIIEAAVDLVDARYGALGVLDDEGTTLSQFITVGLDDEQREAIGELPHGHGILGLLILEPKPIRLPDLHEHPDSYGFPPNHPPMTSFLGVPVRVHDQVFGNLYLTDKRSGEVFPTSTRRWSSPSPPRPASPSRTPGCTPGSPTSCSSRTASASPATCTTP